MILEAPPPYQSHIISLSSECQSLQKQLQRQSTIHSTNMAELRRLSAFEQANGVLVQELREARRERDELRAVLEKKALFVRRNDSFLFEHEVQFSNGWNRQVIAAYQQQHSALEKSVDGVRDEYDKICQQNVEIKRKMMECTLHYQSQIYEMQQKNMCKCHTMSQSTTTPIPLTPNLLSHTDERILHIADQTIQDLRKENAALVKKCQESVAFNLKHMPQSIQSSSKSYHHGIDEVIEILNENTKLKKQLESVTSKLNTILNMEESQISDHYPTIYQHLQLKQQNKQLKRDLLKEKKTHQFLQKQLSNYESRQKQLSAQLDKQSESHTRLYSKLATVFKKMNPYFKIYQYDQINLTKEQKSRFLNKSQSTPIRDQSYLIKQLRSKVQLVQATNHQLVKENKSLQTRLQQTASVIELLPPTIENKQYSNLLSYITQIQDQNAQLSASLQEKDGQIAVLGEKVRYLESNQERVIIPMRCEDILFTTPDIIVNNTQQTDHHQPQKRYAWSNQVKEYEQREEKYITQICLLQEKYKSILQLYTKKINTTCNHCSNSSHSNSSNNSNNVNYTTTNTTNNINNTNNNINNSNNNINNSTTTNTASLLTTLPQMAVLQSSTYLSQPQSTLTQSTQQQIQQLLTKYEKEMGRILTLCQSLVRQYTVIRQEYTPLLQFHPPDPSHYIQQITLLQTLIKAKDQNDQTQEIENLRKERDEMESVIQMMRDNVKVEVNGGRLVSTMVQMIRSREQEIKRLSGEKEEKSREWERRVENRENEELRKCIEMGLVDVLEKAIECIENEE